MKEKRRTEKNRPLWKKLLKALLILLGILAAVLVLVVLVLTVTEYRPGDKEEITVEGNAVGTLQVGQELKIMSWNIGFGALGDNADFFMDGGTMVNPSSKARVLENMDSILGVCKEEAPDILFLQEADRSSDRSHRVNETAMFAEAFPDMQHVFANNFKVLFAPFPIPPMGKIDSGLQTLSSYPIAQVERISLPCPFSWPVRTSNLKRCLLVSRIPLENSEKELVLINLHLEAYDNGEGKIAQTLMLSVILEEEAQKGNYVIAGGDFNQIFSSEEPNPYPPQEGKWQVGQIDVNEFKGDWQFLADRTVPSCRSLDQPYAGADKEGFQYYLIDGFIVSGNLKAESCKGLDLGFTASDHNPVVLTVQLTAEEPAEVTAGDEPEETVQNAEEETGQNAAEETEDHEAEAFTEQD